MSMRRTWSWMDDVLPVVAVLMLTCLDMALLTIVKEVMSDGMGSIVYVIYHNALGTFILLPFFILHIIRKVDRPPLTFRILFRFFILGLFGISLFQVLWYLGVDYSSPTMASAIANLSPGITFLIAVIFRTEKIDIRNSSSVAKLLGTVMAISGTMVFTFYQGPEIFVKIPSPDSANKIFLTHPTSWVFGGLVTLASITFGCIWVVLHATTSREYPDQQTIVFFYCLFGTVQCVALSPFIERSRRAWVLQSGNAVIAVVLGAIYSTAIRNNVLTWCLRKKGPIFGAMFAPLSIVVAVIMGVTILGDSLYLGSVIGATIVAAGFYTSMWGQTKEKDKTLVVTNDNLDVSDKPGSSTDQTAHLLSSRNESEC
ncbi:putative EamA domain-containing protein [Helianthus annuus]|nr:putative EamA domain-containing protein [Helianthus annuus]